MKSKFFEFRPHCKTPLFSFFLLSALFLGMGTNLRAEQHDGQEQARFLRRRPLQRIFGKRTRGTDITINDPQGQGACQSTIVAKKQMESGLCRVGMVTATHCLQRGVRSIVIAGIGEIQRKSLQIDIPKEFNAASESASGDTSTFVFDTDCEKVADVEPVPLAPVNPDGTTVIDTKKVYLQKRQGSVGGNIGEGAQIAADVKSTNGSQFEFYVPTPQGYAIVGGDSGGPIFNEKGQLICAISGSSYEYDRRVGRLTRDRENEDSILDPFDVICDSRAISRVKKYLAKFGLEPTSEVATAPSSSGAVESAGISSGASKGISSGSGSAQQPLLGSLGGGGSDGGGNTGGGGEPQCEGGVCQVPPSGGGEGAHASTPNPLSSPFDQKRPQAEDSVSSTIAPRASGGLLEKGPVPTADLGKAMEEAKKAGIKHIVVRYGNDVTCHFCRELRDNLRRQFGKDSDVMVIKVEDSRPISGTGIPQSELYSLSSDGKWERQGAAQAGAEVVSGYQAKIKTNRARQAKNHGGASPKANPEGSRQPSSQKPEAPRPSSSSSDEAVAAPDAPQNVFNGYQFEKSSSHGGLHFLKPGESPSSENAIFLQRQSDGSRKAARKNSDGSLQVLPEDVQKGLREFYTKFADKVAHLPEKQRRYIEDFSKGTTNANASGSAPPTGSGTSASSGSVPNPPQEQAHSKSASATIADAEARRVIDQYENQMFYTNSNNRRYRYPADMFKDIPEGGTGKLVLAYFGAPRPKLEEAAKKNPLIEVRRYELGSPEHKHAQLFQVQALGVDGLGRKLTRYGMSPEAALDAMMRSDEVKLLEKYVAAKKAVATQGQAQAQPQPQQPQAQAEPKPEARPKSHGSSQTPPSTTEKRETASLPDSQFDKTTLGHFMSGNCTSCHKEPFPSFTSNWQEWEKRLEEKDPEALTWLEKFNSKVVHGEMLANANLNKQDGAGRDFHSFIAQQYQRYFGKKTREIASRTVGSPDADFRVDPSKREEYLAALASANIQDPALKKALMDFDAIYDHVGAPPSSWAFHGGDSGRKGPRPVAFTPSSVVQPHLFKQVNGEWHWKEPFDGGFSVDSKSDGLKTFIVAKFPEDAQGRPIKGVVGTEKSPRNISTTNPSLISTPVSPDRSDLDRIFGSHPEGTTYYEVQYSTKLGKPIVVTVMSREKRINQDGTQAFWSPDVHKPDSSPRAVLDWATAKQKENPDNPDYQRIINAVNHPQQDGVRSDLGADGSGGKPFIVNGKRTGAIMGSKSVLTGVNPQTLLEMYEELPLTSSAGSSGWQLEAQQLFKDTHRGLPVDTQTCNNCHRFAGESFGDVFADAGLPNGSVIAYGSMQGFDGVLSVPQFEAEQLAKYAQSHKVPNQTPYQQSGFIQRFFQGYSSGASPETLLRTKGFPQLSDGPLLPRRK